MIYRWIFWQWKEINFKLRVYLTSRNDIPVNLKNLKNKEMLEKHLLSNLYFWYIKTFQ
jgi:hypothetical protein